MRPTAPAAVALLALAASPASADRVVPKKGPAVRGHVTRTDTEVVVNRYRAKSPQMTYGVVRLPHEEVRRVDEESVPAEVVRRRLEDLRPGDLEGRVGLARYAVGQKATKEAARVLEEALAIDPAHAEALSLYGGAERFAAARRGNPALDPSLRGVLAAYLAQADGRARGEMAKAASVDAAFPWRAEVVERAWRSAREPRDVRTNVPVTFGADRHPGAVFTVAVPPAYEPFTPVPMLLVLHDGGKGGREGTAVVGSGRDAVALYLEQARFRGWLLVCPTAVAAPWTAPANEALLADVLDEATARWNVDLDRVFVAGHGMGAEGALATFARSPGAFAGVAASGGTAYPGSRSVASSGAAAFLYHGTDDPGAAVERTREAADALLAAGADVVYLELAGFGHSFPTEAMREMFDHFRGKRLADAKRPSAWPRSSFLRKPSAAELAALGDPAAAWGR